jgi:hypothetical protein
MSNEETVAQSFARCDRRRAWLYRGVPPCVHNRWSDDDIIDQRANMAMMERVCEENDAERARMGAEISMLRRQVARLVRLWRRKLRRKLWTGARAAIYRKKPAVVSIDARVLEDGFGNVDLDVIRDPPGKRSKFLPRRWTPPRHRTTQRRFTREPIDTDYTPTSTLPASPTISPSDPLRSSCSMPPPQSPSFQSPYVPPGDYLTSGTGSWPTITPDGGAGSSADDSRFSTTPASSTSLPHSTREAHPMSGELGDDRTPWTMTGWRWPPLPPNPSPPSPPAAPLTNAPLQTPTVHTPPTTITLTTTTPPPQTPPIRYGGPTTTPIYVPPPTTTTPQPARKSPTELRSTTNYCNSTTSNTTKSLRARKSHQTSG